MSGLLCVDSGADANLGCKIAPCVGVVACGRWPFLGAEAVFVGLVLGVEVDGPIVGGDGVGSGFEFVRLGLGIPEVRKRSIVGVRPVIRKTSDNERFSVFVSVASSESSPSCGGVCSSTPSFMERLARCWSSSEADGILGGMRTRDGTCSGAIVAVSEDALVFGIAPRGSFRT